MTPQSTDDKRPLYTPSQTRDFSLPSVFVLSMGVALFALILVSAYLMLNADTQRVGLIVFILVIILICASVFRTYQMETAARKNTELYDQSATLLRNLVLVNRIAQNAMFNVDQPIAIKSACQAAATVAQADRAAVFLINYEFKRIQLVEQIGFSLEHQSDGYNLSYVTPPTFNDTLIVEDLQAKPDDGVLAGFHRRGDVRAFAQVPLHSGNIPLGYLVVYHNQPHTYRAIDLELLEILSGQLAAALDNTQLLQALELHAFEQTHLAYLSRISTESLKIEEVSVEIANVMRQITRMDWSMLTLLDEAANSMSILGVSGNGKSPSNGSGSSVPDLPEICSLIKTPSTRALIFHVGQKDISDALHDFMAAQGLVTLVFAPLLADEHLLGLILLGSARLHELNERETQLVETATVQISHQLKNLQVYQQTQNDLQQQFEQLAVIEDIVQRISGSHDFNAIISDVFEAALKSTHADMVDFALLTEADDFWVIEQYTHEGKSQKRAFPQQKDEGIIGKVRQTGEIILTPDNHAVTAYVPTDGMNYQSSLAVPLSNNGSVVGVLNVESQKPNFFTKKQADFLKNLGGHAVISIENAHLLEELQHKIKTLNSLHQLSVAIAADTDSESVVRAVLRTATLLTNAQYAVIYHYDRRTEQPLPTSKNEYGQSLSAQAQRDVFQDIAHRAVVTGEVESIINVMDEYAGRTIDTTPYPSIMAAPITRGDHVHEVLCVGFTEEQHFENRDEETLSLLAIQSAGHLENATLHERIREGSNRMRAILDSTRDGVILLDYRGRLIEVNPAAQRLLGINFSDYMEEPFVDTLLRYVESDGDQQAGYSREELKKLARIERLQPEGITRREFVRVVQPNTLLFVEEIGSPVLDDNDHFFGRLLVLRDITEEKSLEAYREEISSMVVHDLRSPLSAIVSAQKIAMENVALPNGAAAIQQSLKASLSSAERLMTLINTLLDIRKGTAMTLERAPASIGTLINSAVEILQPTAQKHNIPVEIVVPDDLPQVNIDAEKIQRVLINLLDNALRYTPAGKPVQISAELGERGKMMVRIADSGPGIPKGARERVFEQYWQVKENRPLRGTKGSGIGLTFCKTVMDAHGERVWVADESPLPGACFVFTLPTV